MRWIVDVIGAFGYGIGEEITVITNAPTALQAKRNALKYANEFLPETSFHIKAMTPVIKGNA